jgi:outer membrane protein assembly factor BamB
MYLEAGDIYALNAETGEVQWQSQSNYVINPSTGESKWFPENFKVPRIAYGAGFVYAIRNDASIVGLDANTGQEIGVIEILPPPSGQRNEDGSIPNCHTPIDRFATNGKTASRLFRTLTTKPPIDRFVVV